MTNDQRTSAGIRPLFGIAVVCIIAASYLEFRGSESALVWQSFDEALVEADSTGKLIFVDVYAEWSGPCKEMDRTTYTNDTVQTILSTLYVSARMNIDTDDFTDSLKNAWRIGGVPTSMVLAPNGRLIRKIPGYIPTDRMLKWLGDSSLAAFGSWKPFEDAREESRVSKKPLLVVVTRNREVAEVVGKFFFDPGMRSFAMKTFVPTYVTADETPTFGNLQIFAPISNIPARGMVLSVFTPEMKLLGQLVVTYEEMEDQMKVEGVLRRYLEAANTTR